MPAALLATLLAALPRSAALLAGLACRSPCSPRGSRRIRVVPLPPRSGLGANHLQLTAYQRQFNSKLAHLFDQTIPQLGYVPKGPISASSPPGSVATPPRAAATGDASDNKEVKPEVLPPPSVR